MKHILKVEYTGTSQHTYSSMCSKIFSKESDRWAEYLEASDCLNCLASQLDKDLVESANNEAQLEKYKENISYYNNQANKCIKRIRALK